jgi:ankyrin repeat protein
MKLFKNILQMIPIKSLVALGLLLQLSIGFAASSDCSKISTEELKKNLIEAIMQNDEDMVSKILACPEAKDFNQGDLRKALELAAKNNHVNIARSLIRAGADIKDRYSYALEDAAEKGNLDMVKVLLPVQGCDKCDYSLCHYMDINYLNDCRDEALILAAKNNHVDVVKELINSGADVNYQNSWGNIALIEATKKGHVELLQAKARVNAANKNGHTALNMAMSLRNVDLIRELLMHPKIDVSWEVLSVQREYERYLENPDLSKLFLPEEEHKIKLKIYELFKPFMKLKA